MKERDIRKWMLYFIYSIILFEVSTVLAIKQRTEKTEGFSDMLDNKIGERKLKDNDDAFKALLDTAPSEPSTLAFSEFPEAKFTEQQNIMSGSIMVDSNDISKTIFSVESVNAPSKTKNRALKKKALDPELEDLLPNMDSFLATVKPKVNTLKKKSNVNVSSTILSKNDSDDSNTSSLKETKKFSNSCSDAEKLAGKCQNLSLTQPTPSQNQKKLKAFQSFSEEYMDTQKMSNRKLRERYLDETRQKMEEAEKDHHAFLLYASNEYFKIQSKIWKLEKEKYLSIQKKNEYEKIASIKKIIKKTTENLIEYFEAKSKKQRSNQREELKNKMMLMQKAYNEAFLRDYELINHLQGIQQSTHPTFYSWKDHDNEFINKAIIQSL